jgi:hypothetical protein
MLDCSTGSFGLRLAAMPHYVERRQIHNVRLDYFFEMPSSMTLTRLLGWIQNRDDCRGEVWVLKLSLVLLWNGGVEDALQRVSPIEPRLLLTSKAHYDHFLGILWYTV